MKSLYAIVRKLLFQVSKSKPSLALFFSFVMIILVLSSNLFSRTEQLLTSLFFIAITIGVYSSSMQLVILSLGSLLLLITLSVLGASFLISLLLAVTVLLSCYIFHLALEYHKSQYEQFDVDFESLQQENELWKERFDTIHSKLTKRDEEYEVLEKALKDLERRAEKEKTKFLIALQQVTDQQK